MINSVLAWPMEQCLSLWKSMSMAFFFVVVGYEFLMFCYFFLIKFRATLKLYWLYFSLFFLFIAVSRGFFISYDYLMRFAVIQVADDPLFPLTIYRWASFFGWLGSASLVGVLSTLLFTKAEEKKLHKYMRYVLPLIIVGIGSAFLWLPPEQLLNPDYYVYKQGGVDPGIEVVPFLFGKPFGLVLLNYIILPLLTISIPIIFFYLAVRSVGVIRKSAALNGMGFLTYYAGRFAQVYFQSPPWSEITSGLLPPGIILIGLLLLALANLILQN